MSASINLVEQEVAIGTIHEMPDDLKDTLLSNSDVLEKWNKLTPLARNEWTCYVTIPKKQETRDEHLVRLCEDIRKSKKRPCCWPGCPHHRPDAAKWFSKPKY